MECKDAKTLLGEGIITGDLREHLKHCPGCREHEQFLGRLSVLRSGDVPMPSDREWELARVRMGQKRKKVKHRGFYIPALATTAAVILVLFFTVFQNSETVELTPTPYMAYIVASDADLYQVIEAGTTIPPELSGLDDDEIETVQNVLDESLSEEEMLQSLEDDELDEFLDFMEENLRSNT